MTSVIPPTQYFPTIIYNPEFWNNTASSSGQYLARVGTPTSIATNTTFTGAITTTDLTCVNVIQGTALNSNNAYSSNNNANLTHYLTYTDLSTNGYGQLQKHATLTYNPNQEILTAENINATASLQVGGVDISSIYFPVSSLSLLAFLGYANIFTQVNEFTSTSSGGSANFYNPPYISNTGFTFLSTSLITKAYADSQYLTSTTGVSLSGNNTFTGTNTFSAIPKTTATPTTSTDLIPKAYADTNYSNSALLASNNTWTGTNQFSNAINVSSGSSIINCGTSENIRLRFNNNTIFEISSGSSSFPISVSTVNANITVNYDLTIAGSYRLYSNNISTTTPANTSSLFTNSTNTITIGNTSRTDDLIIGGNIKQNDYYRFKSNPTLITTATTISSPFYRLNKFAMVTLLGYTITLPEVNSSNLDMELVFKRMGGSLQTLTLAPVNSQAIFNNGNSRGQITNVTISTSQNLTALLSTQVSIASSGNFSVTAQPTNIITILSVSAGAYISIGQKINLPAPTGQRIITGYGTGNGLTGTYTCSVNITTNYTNQPYTGDANFGWLLLENN